MGERDQTPEELGALVGTPGPLPDVSVDGKVMSISPIGQPLDPDTFRRQVALDMAIEARAREAERGDVLDLAAKYDDFLRGGVEAS